jgi:hypothetical protein
MRIVTVLSGHRRLQKSVARLVLRQSHRMLERLSGHGASGDDSGQLRDAGTRQNHSTGKRRNTKSNDAYEQGQTK